MQKVNIVIGRFQPFTKGHLKCVEMAWNELHVPTVICMINTKDDKVDERKPFPSSLLVPLYNEAFKKDERIEKVVLVSNADIVKIAEACRAEGYEICSWTCGTDRYDDYKKKLSSVNDELKTGTGVNRSFTDFEKAVKVLYNSFVRK